MECYKDYFIHNFKLKPSSEFDEQLFSFGISIYEVIRIEKGVSLFLEDHLSRLFYSADLSNLTINESYCDFETLIGELIKKNKVYEGKIKLIVRFDKNSSLSEKDLLIYFTPHYFPTIEEYKKGVKVGSCKAIRLNPNAKILDSEARKKANYTIAEQKLFEVLLIDNEGFITEGSRSNIFFIKNNIVITPPEKDVLNGITRKNIIKICRQNNIELIEKKVHISEVNDMEAFFLTGTSIKVLPIKNFDNMEFNINQNVLIQIMKLYDESISNYIKSKI